MALPLPLWQSHTCSIRLIMTEPINGGDVRPQNTDFFERAPIRLGHPHGHQQLAKNWLYISPAYSGSRPGLPRYRHLT